MADALCECAHPSRCGSDGTKCSHQDCRWSDTKRLERQHLEIIADRILREHGETLRKLRDE